MTEQRTEYSEWLAITTGVCGDGQAGSFGNATLQPVAGEPLEFSVATHIGVPAGIDTEDKLRDYLADVLGKVTALGLGIAFEVQLGPEGRGEDF